MTKRQSVRITALVAVVALTAGGGVLWLNHRMDRPTVPATAADQRFVTAPITRMTLVETSSLEGVLGHGPSEPIGSRATGTLTWLPEVGAVLRRGDIVLRADEKPVVLLYGTLPMYRAIARDADGADVEQFETNMQALGFGGFTVDRKYTAATEAAVKLWQRQLQVAETGVVDVTAVVYVAGPIWVANRLARLGADAFGDVLSQTSEAKVVTAQAPALGAAWAVPGTKVTVLVPGGATVEGVVAGVGTEASSNPGSNGSGETGGGRANATVTITVTIANQAAIGRLDRAPVTVRYSSQQRRDVLTVSVAALLAPIEGGYAIEIVNGDSTRVVPVETGLFADGRVEIRGPGLEAGMIVRVPA